MSARETFLSALAPAARDIAASAPALDQLLEDGTRAARERYSTFHVSTESFLRHLAHHLSDVADPLRALQTLHWEELWLTLACAEGQARACAALEADYFGEIPGAIRHLRRGDVFAEEVQQRVRERLLVAAHPDPPKIAGYSGRGPLRAWLRVSAVRVALNLVEEERRPGSANHGPNAVENAASDPLIAVTRAHDFEMDHLRQRFGPLFKLAFGDALERLPVEARMLLRLHLVEGLNIDQIGTLKGVHRATVARWIASARDELYERTRTAILAGTQLSPSEFQSLGVLLRSEMDQSVLRILNEDASATTASDD